MGRQSSGEHASCFFFLATWENSSTIIENIKTIVQNQSGSGLAYFYFDINDKAKQTSESLLSSLVLSFTAKSKNYLLIEHLYEQHDQLHKPTEDELLHLLMKLLCCFKEAYCYDKHALRADVPIPRMFSLSSCTMTLLYLCLTDMDTIIPLRLPPPVSPPVWPSPLFYLHTIPCSLVLDTSHLYSLIQCNNTTEATLGATSEVRAERVRRHAGVLAQPRSHSLGGRRLLMI